MNSNIILPRLEGTIITKIEVRGGRYIIHFEMPLKMHCCPSCELETNRVHDYRITKIKHLKIMERMTILFYRKRRYVCDCGKRFAEDNPVVKRFQRYSKE
ncbi:transposase family protein [Ureibacillus composti]